MHRAFDLCALQLPTRPFSKTTGCHASKSWPMLKQVGASAATATRDVLSRGYRKKARLPVQWLQVHNHFQHACPPPAFEALV